MGGEWFYFKKKKKKVENNFWGIIKERIFSDKGVFGGFGEWEFEWGLKIFLFRRSVI